MKHVKIVTALVGCALLFCVLLWRISKQPTFQFFGDLLYRAQTQEKIVALTFDDGPSPNNTHEILSILKSLDVQATFFMIGNNIEKYPELAKEVMLSHHQIGNHTFSHQKTLLSSKEFFRDEIVKTDTMIRNLGYQDEIVFRPPFGKKLFNLPLALSELGKLSVTWDVESEDTETQDFERLKENVLTRVQPGSIILFHDGFASKPGTKDAIKAIIQVLKSQGYQFVTINQMRDKVKMIGSR